MEQLYLDTLIADDLRYKIERGVYRNNERLPSEHKLSEIYHAQKMTIRASLQILKDEGYIYSVDKSGYYVKPARILKDIHRFQSTTNLLQTSGKESGSKLLRFEVIEANKDISAKIEMTLGTRLYYLERLRSIDSIPSIIEISYIPVLRFPDLKEFDLSTRSLYEILDQHFFVQADRSEMEISVAYAGMYEAELLPVEENDPLIKESGRVYDGVGRIIEYTERLMPIDRFQFIR